MSKERSTPRRSAKSIAIQRVLDAAMQWHYQFSRADPDGDFRAFIRAGNLLDSACARLKKVSKR